MAAVLMALAVACDLAGAQPSEAPKLVSDATGHEFTCADYSQGKILLISRDAKVEWEYQTTNCNDLWVLPNGNLLFNTG